MTDAVQTKALGDITTSPLWVDIRDVMTAKKTTARWSYKAMFHTEKEDIAVGPLLHWEENRDYGGNIGASSHISFQLGLGDYEYRLYPYREHLEMSVRTIALDDTGKEKEDGSVIQRFKVIFHPDKNPIITANKDGLQDATTLNSVQTVTVLLELQDRALEPLRRKMVTGASTFREVTVERLIRAVLVAGGQQLIIDGKPAVDGIEFDTPDNSELQSEIIVPHGTLLSNLPTWCQEKGCGVYSTGIGTFFQRYDNKNLWFVYPLYRFKKFDTAKKKLVIFSVPDGKLNGLDKTYKVEGDTLKILSVNGSEIKDEAGNSELSTGFGFRMVNAKAVMSKPVEMIKGVANFARHRIMTEVGHMARKDGMQFAPVVKPSANNFHEFSKVLPSHSIHVTAIWENADPNLLFPGMAIKYIYQAHGKYVELKGCLTGVFINRSLQGRPGTATIYTTHVTLGMILESKEEQYDLPTHLPPGSF